jgi:inosine/xanthosine triphosphate pyrophosphatase family protein
VEKIVVASKNPAKVARYGRMLSKYAKETVGLDALGITDKPEETGETAEENAQIKGIFYANRAGLPVFSEDEALYVDFLPKDKQPGVHVRRIKGRNEASDDELLSYWEKIVAKVPEDKRTGRWQIAYCITSPSGRSKSVILNHPIIFFSPTSKVKLPGWPMSSLEGPVEFGKPHSELIDEERKQHEENSNQQIIKKLEELMGELQG